jgi:hypothetical protein
LDDRRACRAGSTRHRDRPGHPRAGLDRRRRGRPAAERHGVGREQHGSPARDRHRDRRPRLDLPVEDRVDAYPAGRWHARVVARPRACAGCGVGRDRARLAGGAARRPRQGGGRRAPRVRVGLQHVLAGRCRKGASRPCARRWPRSTAATARRLERLLSRTLRSCRCAPPSTGRFTGARMLARSTAPLSTRSWENLRWETEEPREGDDWFLCEGAHRSRTRARHDSHPACAG